MLYRFMIFAVLASLVGCGESTGSGDDTLSVGDRPGSGDGDSPGEGTATDGSTGDGTRYTSVGVSVECGANTALRALCSKWTGLGQLSSAAGSIVTEMCSGEVKAVVACNGVPGEDGTSCEACAGIGWDKAFALGGQAITADSAGLYCFDFDRNEGHMTVFAGTGGQLSVGGYGVHAGCGGYSGGGEEGTYCRAGVDVDLTPWGVPVKCNLGVVAIDPEAFVSDVETILASDPVADSGPLPGAISVGCFDGEDVDHREPIEGRCTEAVGRMDSGGKSDFGYAVACSDAWENDCSYISDCPEAAITGCDAEWNDCVSRSLEACE